MTDADPPLFQEALRGDPFWMVVGCLLVNRASWTAAAPIHAELRAGCVDAAGLAGMEIRTLEMLLRPLGFVGRRPALVHGLAALWATIGGPYDAEHIMTYPGCGRYARDTWAIFVEGRRDVEPTDRRLRQYLARESRT